MAVCPRCGYEACGSRFCPECGSDLESGRKADDSTVTVLDVTGEYHAPVSLSNVTEIRATGDVHIPVGFDGPLRSIRTTGDIYIPRDLDVRTITAGRIVFNDQDDDL